MQMFEERARRQSFITKISWADLQSLGTAEKGKFTALAYNYDNKVSLQAHEAIGKAKDL